MDTWIEDCVESMRPVPDGLVALMEPVLGSRRKRRNWKERKVQPGSGQLDNFSFSFFLFQLSIL